MVEANMLVKAISAGFGLVMAAWLITWGITKVINLFKLITKV
jgi:hypothetical protein